MANLPQFQSETILLNVFTIALKQLNQNQITEKQFFATLLKLACKEGLPLACLQSVWDKQ
ncbi:hypothetical protein [Spirosoma pollinicola]|nr:hypothetical protein [Spirosoma pollinicola]